MDIIWALGLVIFVFVALNHMAGGRASNILNPVFAMAERLLRNILRSATTLVSSILKLGIGSLRLPGRSKNRKENIEKIEPPARSWKKKDLER